MRDDTFKSSATSSIVRSLMTGRPRTPVPALCEPAFEVGLRGENWSPGGHATPPSAWRPWLWPLPSWGHDLGGVHRLARTAAGAFRWRRGVTLGDASIDPGVDFTSSHATAFRPSETGFGNLPLRIAS